MWKLLFQLFILEVPNNIANLGNTLRNLQEYILISI